MNKKNFQVITTGFTKFKHKPHKQPLRQRNKETYSVDIK